MDDFGFYLGLLCCLGSRFLLGFFHVGQGLEMFLLQGLVIGSGVLHHFGHGLVMFGFFAP